MGAEGGKEVILSLSGQRTEHYSYYQTITSRVKTRGFYIF